MKRFGGEKVGQAWPAESSVSFCRFSGIAVGADRHFHRIS
jgi:hypothetical protein